MYWYHPHHHGTVAGQIFGGLYGAVIVGDPAAAEMASAVSRERVLVISGISLDGSGHIRGPSTMDRMVGRQGELILINGQVQPILTARPGKRQRWRIVNACVARYLRLGLDGQRLQLLGIDSGRYPTPLDIQELVLAPGNRADLLVTTLPGTAHLRAVEYDRGTMTGMMGAGGSGDGGMPGMAGGQLTTPAAGKQDAAVVLGSLEVTGAAVSPPSSPPSLRSGPAHH